MELKLTANNQAVQATSLKSQNTLGTQRQSSSNAQPQPKLKIVPAPHAVLNGNQISDRPITLESQSSPASAREQLQTQQPDNSKMTIQICHSNSRKRENSGGSGISDKERKGSQLNRRRGSKGDEGQPVGSGLSDVDRKKKAFLRQVYTNMQSRHGKNRFYAKYERKFNLDIETYYVKRSKKAYATNRGDQPR